MTINFNTEPYYDDFDEAKKFYRILYRPSYAVQARELTQMQSILQNQISKFGSHVFKNGAMVIPGQISVDTNISYIKLESTYNNVLTDELLVTYVGKIISNTNGLKAQVIYYARSDGTDPPTLFVKYTNSQTNNNTTKVFTAGDVLTDTAVGTTLASVQVYATSPTGTGSISQIEQGVYYIKNHFVLVTPQTIILDKYGSTPTYRIGVLATESVTIPEDDDSLLDNAQNSYNYAAPGAHRYTIDLTLTKLSTSSTSDTDFVELVRVNSGKTVSIVEKTDYNEVEKTLARRTFDESGNYTVRPFNIDVREHRNNNRGAWVVGKAYLIGDVVTNGGYVYVAKNNATSVGQSGVGPTHTTGTSYDGGSTSGVNWEYQVNVDEVFYNRGVYTPENGGDETKLAIGLEPGKAYVEGYEIEKISTTYVPVKKARDYISVDNSVISATMGNYITVTNTNGAPPIENFSTVNLYNIANASVGAVPTPVSISNLVIAGTAGQFTFTSVSPSSLYGGQLITISGVWGAGTVATVGTITGYTLTLANAASVTATTGTNVISGLTTTSLTVGMPLQFNAAVGSVAANTTYYVLSIPTSGSITISATPGGTALSIASTTTATATVIATINAAGTTYRISTSGLSATGFTLVQNDTTGTALVTTTGTPTGLTVTTNGLIGTARVRGFEWNNGTVGSQTAQYKLSLFDVKLNPGFSLQRDLKSIFYDRSNVKTNFTADIQPNTTRLAGTATVPVLIPTVATSGTAGQFTCGQSTLAVGDLITITGTNAGTGTITGYTTGTTYKVSAVTGTSPSVTGFTLTTTGGSAIVTTAGTLIGLTYTTQSSNISGSGTSFQTDLKVGDYLYLGSSSTRVRVASINSQQSITIDTQVTVTGVTIDRLSTDIIEPQNAGLIFPFPNYAIRSVSNIIYTAVQKFTGTTGVTDSGGTGYCTLTIVTSAGTFASSAVTENYVVVYSDTSAGGVVLLPTSITGATTSTVTITLPNAYAGKAMTVFAAVNKSSSSVGSQRTKVLTTATPVTFTTQATATASDLYLGKADGYRIIAVKMKSGTFASPGATYSIDISDRYDFDDGQRPTHYDLAKISLKSSYPPPVAPIQVEFQYFAHNGTGDFFTASSYTNIDYKAIPFFLTTPLRDCIDFRPRIDDNGTTFTPAASTASLMPKRGNDVTCSFSYYLPRKSRIGVNTLGVFTVVDGVSALIPGDPVTTQMNMVLYNLSLEAYTFTTGSTSVAIEKIDNKRYTMRDISKLEKRIDNLEYYTSLSLLEQQTESLKITDSVGLDRFKNGFIVDNFSGHNVGNTNSPDYLCSIDMEKKQLRPFYTNNNVNMLEAKSSDVARAAANYKLYGDVITLPVVDNPILINQPYASRLENINPFAIYTFIGDVVINPASDDWFETIRRPDIIIDVEGNYNSVKNMAEKSGVLGTIWNAWQTVWTGKPVATGAVRVANQSNMSAADLNAMFGYKKGAGNSSLRSVTYEVVATSTSQQRTGVSTIVQQKLDQVLVADRVLSTVAIPYIRSRNLLIQIKKLKPSTRFYPYFDGVDISAYCTPATKLYYTQPSGTGGTFNTTTNVGSNSIETARLINTDSQTCLNRGDVITGGTSGATAVVVGTEYNPETGLYALSVVNCSSTAFQINETITGTISGATAKVSAVPTIATIGGSLVTNAAGDVNLLFNIPNTESTRFRCGNRELKLVDSVTADGEFTSRARANYMAQGVLETKQATINSVRNGLIVEEQVYDNQTLVATSNRVVSDTGWYDPLAQTFLIQSPGGAFLSSVDIFFAGKDSNIPVTLEIREVVNGYPGKRVLPFSRVTLTPSQVSLSTNTVLLDSVSVKSYDTPTKFSFPSPVYVQDNTEYCFVLASDSNNYRVWISQLGDTIPGSARTISEQPYAGVMFKSQNASTWTADASQDIKFTIYRCQFQTGVTANVQFWNDKLPLQTLDNNPFEIRTGSTTVRVWQRDHGMPPGSTVTISGVGSALNGIPAAEINGNKIISNVDIDSYTIAVTTTPTSTGFAGGSGIKATRNIQFDACQPSMQVQTFSETAVDFKIRTTSGQSVDSTVQTPYVLDAVDGIGIVSNDTNYFSTPRMVASAINEQVSTLASAKSLTLTATMSTTNNALSPIIDTDRTSFITISNKANAPTDANTNVSGLDDNVITSSNTNIAFTAGQTITSTDTTTKGYLSALSVGKYLTIAGSGTSSNNGTYLITAVATDGSSVTLNKTFSLVPAGTAITLTQRERFVDEIAPLEGSGYSSYVTKKVNFANPCKFLKVIFGANIPKEASVEVYYKNNKVGTTVTFDTVNWVQMTPDSTIVNYDNSTNTFVDISYSLSDLPSFDGTAIKIVMKSINTAAVPIIRDLRVIACA